MSHLSRSRDLSFDDRLGAGAIPGSSAVNSPRGGSPRPELATHADDFSWVMGRVAPSARSEDRLAVLFEAADGQKREIPLERHPALRMIRPGDKVMVEGDLVQESDTGRSMRVRKVALIP
ncbi:hypothetical protein K2X85_12645 [bacterium]|nr:hypothetical protein [bacterium]